MVAALVQPSGSSSEPGAFGISAEGTAAGSAPTTNVSARALPQTIPSAATSAAAANSRASSRPLPAARRQLGQVDPGPPTGLGLRDLPLDVLLLERVLEGDEEVVAVRGRVRGHLAVDLARDDEFDQRAPERLHLEELALLDRVDLVGAVLADQVGDARVGDHHLERRDPAVVDLGQRAG